MEVQDSVHVSTLRGITLIEVLITLALIVILSSWGIPEFIALYQKNTLASEVNTLLTHLMQTRSEAMKRNVPVVICRSENGSSCLRSGSSSTDWSVGWLIYANADDDKLRDPVEPIIRVRHKLPSNLSLHFNGWWRLTFKPTGRTGNGTFTFCDLQANSRRIIVYRSGRFRVSEHVTQGSANPCGAS